MEPMLSYAPRLKTIPQSTALIGGLLILGWMKRVWSCMICTVFEARKDILYWML
jgi:hypothetical protein